MKTVTITIGCRVKTSNKNINILLIPEVVKMFTILETDNIHIMLSDGITTETTTIENPQKQSKNSK